MIMRNLRAEHCGQAMIQLMHGHHTTDKKGVTVKATVHMLPAWLPGRRME